MLHAAQILSSGRNKHLNLVNSIALEYGYSNAEITAAVEHHARKNRRINPPGTFDRSGRFDASERTTPVQTCRAPSRAYPYPEMLAARTAAHCAELLGANLTAVKRLYSVISKTAGLQIDGSAHERIEATAEIRRMLSKPVKRSKRLAAAAKETKSPADLVESL